LIETLKYRKQVKNGAVADAGVAALLESMVKNDEALQAKMDIMDVCNKKGGCEFYRVIQL